MGIGEVAGLTIFPRLWSEQRTALIVATVHQDGPQPTVMEIAGVQQRPPLRYSKPHRGAETPTHQGRASMSPLASRRCIGLNWSGLVDRVADVVMAQRDGRNRGKLRRAAVVAGL
jgi:hypothetical protein